MITLPQCRHTFCLACTSQYLQTKMDSFEVLKVSCPQGGCDQHMPDATIKAALTEEQNSRYRELVAKKIGNREYQKICPQPRCLRVLVPVVW